MLRKMERVPNLKWVNLMEAEEQEEMKKIKEMW